MNECPTDKSTSKIHPPVPWISPDKRKKDSLIKEMQNEEREKVKGKKEIRRMLKQNWRDDDLLS